MFCGDEFREVPTSVYDTSIYEVFGTDLFVHINWFFGSKFTLNLKKNNLKVFSNIFEKKNKKITRYDNLIFVAKKIKTLNEEYILLPNLLIKCCCFK